MNEIKLLHQNGILSIENNLIRRQYSTGDAFFPLSFLLKNEQCELLMPKQRWFECVVNGGILTAGIYRTHHSRPLKHGGLEVTIIFASKDIMLKYQIQIFPGSSITRERLMLFPENVSFRLHYSRDKPHFIFPEYAVHASAPPIAEEIRLATWNYEQMPEANINAFPLDRIWGITEERALNLSQCDMYHPVFLSFKPVDAELRKGPIIIGTDKNQHNWIVAYEHGSPDNDSSKDYIKIGTNYHDKKTRFWVSMEKGAFFDGEEFTAAKPFVSPWTNLGTFNDDDIDQGRKAFRDYLYYWQSETLAGRKPCFYYNTWGWQRADEDCFINVDAIKDIRKGRKIYCDATVYHPISFHNISSEGGRRKHFSPDEVLFHKDRLLHEIDCAHELGVDVFVLDDGWYDWMGDWKIHPQFGSKGLSDIVKCLEDYNMRAGLWLAPTCVDPNSRFFAEHPENMARAQNGEIVPSRFGRKMACLVSAGYAESFMSKCKTLIDLGFTYFKWDALDGWYCYSDQHLHGNNRHCTEDRGHRYGYEFVRIINQIAQELIAYCPDLVLVYDVTESGRFVGLDFLSQGRFFWMNNGASGYHDLSTYRAKSMRTIYQRYHSIIPTILQTSAQYPHFQKALPKNRKVSGTQQYKVFSALVGGNGFWGDLSQMEAVDRISVREILRNYRRVANSVVSSRPKVTGVIGGSPEIYEFIDSTNAQGQLIAFSGSILKHTYYTEAVNRNRFFGIIGHAYQRLEDNRVKFDFVFTEPDAVRGCFILGNNSSGIRLEKSTCWLKNIVLKSQTTLLMQNGAPGKMTVHAPQTRQVPLVRVDGLSFDFDVEDTINEKILALDIQKADSIIEIEFE